jgi:hypothetical protein
MLLASNWLSASKPGPVGSAFSTTDELRSTMDISLHLILVPCCRCARREETLKREFVIEWHRLPTDTQVVE